MDAADVEAITKIVKTVGAEFKGASDEDIKFWIELQAPVISRKKFGADYNLALALLTWVAVHRDSEQAYRSHYDSVRG